MSDQPVAAEAAIAEAIREKYADWDDARAEHPIYLDFVRLGVELSTFQATDGQIADLAESLAAADDVGAFDDDTPDVEAGMARFIVNALMALSGTIPGQLSLGHPSGLAPFVTQAGATRALVIDSPTGPVAILIDEVQAEWLFDAGVNWEPVAPEAAHVAIVEVLA